MRSWLWVEVQPETCRAVSRYNKLRKFVSCWIYIGLYLRCTDTWTSNTFHFRYLFSLCRWTRQKLWTRSITELASSREGISYRRYGFSKTQVVRRVKRLELTSAMFNLGHRAWTYCIYKFVRVNLQYKLFLFCQMEHTNLTIKFGSSTINKRNLHNSSLL